MKETINHPDHYNAGGLEVIDVIKAFTEGMESSEAFAAGNAIKYICRYKKKNGVEDLRKAKWYIDYLIDLNTEKKAHAVPDEYAEEEFIYTFIFADHKKLNAVTRKIIGLIKENGYITEHEVFEAVFSNSVADFKYCAGRNDVGWLTDKAFAVQVSEDLDSYYLKVTAPETLFIPVEEEE